MGPAWRSLRAGCATRSASTGIRSPGSCGSPTTAGNAGPEDELNRIPNGQEGANFGFPYCHADGVPDPDIKKPNACAGVILPAALTGPHSAGLGIKFYTGTMFPAEYRDVAFIARRGSWNREPKFGYDVVVAKAQPDGIISSIADLPEWLERELG